MGPFRTALPSAAQSLPLMLHVTAMMMIFLKFVCFHLPRCVPTVHYKAHSGTDGTGGDTARSSAGDR